MKPRAFDYIRPETIDEAVAVLAEYGDDARILAGGQSLMAMMNLRMAEPKVLIDIGGHQDLKSIRLHGDFAILSLAAIAEDDTTIRLGIGGLADRPVATHIHIESKSTVQDALDALAWELEGTDDIHATAHYRRDLLRRMGPLVIEEAIRCAV